MCPVSSAQFKWNILAMTKPDKMHCVVDIETIGEQVRTRRNDAHWGSWDTVYTYPVALSTQMMKRWSQWLKQNIPLPSQQCPLIPDPPWLIYRLNFTSTLPELQTNWKTKTNHQYSVTLRCLEIILESIFVKRECLSHLVFLLTSWTSSWRHMCPMKPYE